MEFAPKLTHTKPIPPTRSNSLPAVGLLNQMSSFQAQEGNTGSPFKNDGKAMEFKYAINKERRDKTMKTRNAAMNQTNVTSMMTKLNNASLNYSNM